MQAFNQAGNTTANQPDPAAGNGAMEPPQPDPVHGSEPADSESISELRKQVAALTNRLEELNNATGDSPDQESKEKR